MNAEKVATRMEITTAYIIKTPTGLGILLLVKNLVAGSIDDAIITDVRSTNNRSLMINSKYTKKTAKITFSIVAREILIKIGLFIVSFIKDNIPRDNGLDNYILRSFCSFFSSLFGPITARFRLFLTKIFLATL